MAFSLPIPLIPAVLPPSPEAYTSLIWIFSLFPFFALTQFLTTWYPMGKTSLDSSRFNLPGKIGWVLMEVPGSLSLLYVLWSLPQQLHLVSANDQFSAWAKSLDEKNLILAGMFVLHYINRAVISPLFLNPSMSPIHLFVWVSALSFQLFNGISMGAWLGGYGPKRGDGYWQKDGTETRFWVGVGIWALGLAGNIWHDELLRNLRRPGFVDDSDNQATVKKDDDSTGEKKSVHKVYHMPQGGLFGLVLYAHYLLEWIEWIGFWIAAGSGCAPARNFVLNEVLSMGPRAYNGWYWYVDKFGREKVGSRKAVIPWLF
jgi:3-oxo-5-alpha-steroid 4-dehydrogenase 1